MQFQNSYVFEQNGAAILVSAERTAAYGGGAHFQVINSVFEGSTAAGSDTNGGAIFLDFPSGPKQYQYPVPVHIQGTDFKGMVLILVGRSPSVHGTASLATKQMSSIHAIL